MIELRKAREGTMKRHVLNAVYNYLIEEQLKRVNFGLSSVINEVDEVGTALTLSVYKINPALNLYSSLGFKIVDEKSHSYIMIKE